MLFKSNKFFNLKSKRNVSETSYPKIDITENMCDHTVEYWQLSINLCQFFNFLLHVTGKSYHFFRFNYLEVCHFLVYLYICEVQVLNFTGSAIFGIPYPKFCDRHIFLLFLNKHFELSHVLLFCNGTFTMLMLNFYV